MPNRSTIVSGVNKAVEKLIKNFKDNPNHFFTENDLICALHRLIKDALGNELIYRDNFLLHCEYPTPFKCDMSGYKFRYVADNERHKRGHFDISIIDPSFIDTCGGDYQKIKAQHFSQFLTDRDANIQTRNPILLYAIELMFSRDPKRTRGCFRKSISQDAEKLRATKADKHVLANAKTLCFFHGNIPLDNEKWKVIQQNRLITLICSEEKS